MGRPSTKPTKLKDGYYIELKNTGEKSGVKIRRDTKKEIDIAIERYKKTKDVKYIGQVKNGKVVSS
jgi:hypothetical protein